MADPAETTQASGTPAAEDLLEAVRTLSAQVGSLRGELQALRRERAPLPASDSDLPGWGDRGPAGSGAAWLGALERPLPRRPALPRLALELLFLAAVALAAALADLEPPAIVAVMAGAWALVALAEWLDARAERRLEDAEGGLGALPLASEDPSWFGPPLERTAPPILAVSIVAAGALAVAGGARPTLSGGAPAGAPAARPAVLDLGDSLSVGTAPYLRRKLRDYRIRSIHDVGLHAYDAAALVARRRAELPPVLVVSAGTNDDPRIVSTFSRAVREILAAAGPGRCVVWPTIVRPPAAGASYAGFNRALARLASRHRNLVLVDWVGLVARHPAWLAGDGVHVSVAGYRARAAAIAAAVRFRCPA